MPDVHHTVGMQHDSEALQPQRIRLPGTVSDREETFHEDRDLWHLLYQMNVLAQGKNSNAYHFYRIQVK